MAASGHTLQGLSMCSREKCSWASSATEVGLYLGRGRPRMRIRQTTMAAVGRQAAAPAATHPATSAATEMVAGAPPSCVGSTAPGRKSLPPAVAAALATQALLAARLALAHQRCRRQAQMVRAKRWWGALSPALRVCASAAARCPTHLVAAGRRVEAAAVRVVGLLAQELGLLGAAAQAARRTYRRTLLAPLQ